MDSITEAKLAGIFDRAKVEALALLREQDEMRAEHLQFRQDQAGDDDGLTVAEAAQMIGVKEWRVYEMIKRGILPASRPSPRTLRLRRGAVRDFIRDGRCSEKPSKQRAGRATFRAL